MNKRRGLDAPSRSEFPQYQPYQCYVRVVVLGVLILSSGPKTTALAQVPRPLGRRHHRTSLAGIAHWFTFGGVRAAGVVQNTMLGELNEYHGVLAGWLASPTQRAFRAAPPMSAFE